MKNLWIHLAGIALAVGMVFPLAGCPRSPDSLGGTVSDRTNLDNDLPGCEKVDKVCRRVRICLKNGPCQDYAPSEVKNCKVGSPWPKCKEES